MIGQNQSKSEFMSGIGRIVPRVPPPRQPDGTAVLVATTPS